MKYVRPALLIMSKTVSEMFCFSGTSASGSPSSFCGTGAGYSNDASSACNAGSGDSVNYPVYFCMDGIGVTVSGCSAGTGASSGYSSSCNTGNSAGSGSGS
jgi:hypothetical protein